jgi:hypothetical protein
MVLLFVSASWILAVSVIAGLCIAARDGDLHDRPTSPAVQDPHGHARRSHDHAGRHGQPTLSEYAPSDLAKAANMSRRTIRSRGGLDRATRGCWRWCTNKATKPAWLISLARRQRDTTSKSAKTSSENGLQDGRAQIAS